MALLAVVFYFYFDFEFFLTFFTLALDKNAPAHSFFIVCNGHFIAAIGAFYFFQILTTLKHCSEVVGKIPLLFRCRAVVGQSVKLLEFTQPLLLLGRQFAVDFQRAI